MAEEEGMLECPICFERMTDIAYPFSAQDAAGVCSHSFCMGCMQGIYDLSKSHGKFPQCPICRRNINSFARNQLASSLVAHVDKLKASVRDIKDRAVEKERQITADNEHMAQRIAELETGLAKSNVNNQADAERRKMLHLLESEKKILTGNLQDAKDELDAKEQELEEATRRIDELEQQAQRYQDDSLRAHKGVEVAQARIAEMQGIIEEKEALCQEIREEKIAADSRIEELQEHVEGSDAQLKKALGECEDLQDKVSELERLIATNEALMSSKTDEISRVERYLVDMEARLKETEMEFKRSKEGEAKYQKRLAEMEYSVLKSDSERANNGLLVSRLEDTVNRYKQDIKILEGEKHEYGKKVADLEGALAKCKIDLRKTEDEKNGLKERAWKAERDSENLRKDLEKLKIDHKEKEDTSKQTGYLSGLMKTTMNLNPLSALWGSSKHTGPLVRSFSDVLFYERRGNTKDSCVWRGQSKATGIEFAIKKIVDSAPVNAQGISDMSLFREALILKKIDHPSITKLDSVAFEKGALYFVYTPFVSMDLDYASRAVKLNAIQIKSIVYQLLCATNYLHRQELVHRNLKPTSVLMSEDCNIKICGFSQARSVLGGKPLDLYIPPQPINYVAPEIVASEFGISVDSINWKAADIWSIGCIFAELLLAGEPLFSGKDRASYLTSVSNILDCVSDMSGLYPTTDSKTLSVVLSKSPHASHPSFRSAVEVAQAMLKFDPSARQEASYILQHKYFADVLNAADVSRGKELSREVTDNCIPQFVNEFCTGIV